MRLLLPILVEFPLSGNLVLPVGFLLFGDFSRSSSSKTCERKYCPSSRFMVAPLLFLISMASFTHLLYLFCSVPMTFALSHPITWFFSTTWSVTADLWTDDSDWSQSLSSVHKSAVTDHVVEKNHVIGWDRAKVIGTEQNRYKRWVKEAIEIRKRRGATMNRDEGQYFLSHVFDELLLEKSPKRRKPTGNTKFPESGNSTGIGSSSLI